MKITLDSAEPLEDAIRVLGAMYNVQLVVSSKQETTQPVENGSSRALSASAKAPRRQRRSRRDNGQSAAGGAIDSSGKSESRVVASGMASPSNAQVRSWARENGFSVSDRGRLAASVMAAYHSAKSK